MLMNAGFIAKARHQNNPKCSIDNNRTSLRYEGDSSMGHKFAVLDRSSSPMGLSLCSDRLHSDEEENQELPRKVLLAFVRTPENRHSLTSCNSILGLHTSCKIISWFRFSARVLTT